MRPRLARWVLGCAAAEAVGMSAAATASRVSTGSAVLPALTIVVAGGLVEGAALGTVQAWLLGGQLSRLRRRRFATVTVLVAGVGWALGSLPGVLAGDGSGAAPPVALTVLAGAGLGIGMGLVLGLAQGAVLHRAAPGWRWWPPASTLAWTPAMALVFAGASVPGAGWPLGAVTATGTLTGAVAGSVLGLVLGALAPRLDAPWPARDRHRPGRGGAHGHTQDVGPGAAPGRSDVPGSGAAEGASGSGATPRQLLLAKLLRGGHW